MKKLREEYPNIDSENECQENPPSTNTPADEEPESGVASSQLTSRNPEEGDSEQKSSSSTGLVSTLLMRLVQEDSGNAAVQGLESPNIPTDGGIIQAPEFLGHQGAFLVQILVPQPSVVTGALVRRP